MTITWIKELLIYSIWQSADWCFTQEKTEEEKKIMLKNPSQEESVAIY